eukprot:gene26448-17547_t
MGYGPVRAHPAATGRGVGRSQPGLDLGSLNKRGPVVPPRAKPVRGGSQSDGDDLNFSASKIQKTVTSVRKALIDLAIDSVPRKDIPEAPPVPEWQSATYLLVAINATVFLLVNTLQLAPWASMQLSVGKSFSAWQLLSSCFLHVDALHLAENCFMGYTFGRLVERVHGAVGLWAAYLLPALGANGLAMWIFSASTAKGAALATVTASSAATLALFLVGLALPRIHRKPLELLCLAPFVALTTLNRYSSLSTSLIDQGAGRLVHVAGSAVVACVVFLVLSVVRLMKEAREEEERLKEVEERAKQRKAKSGELDAAIAGAINTAAKAAVQFTKKLI